MGLATDLGAISPGISPLRNCEILLFFIFFFLCSDETQRVSPSSGLVCD